MGVSLHYETQANECQPGFMLVDDCALPQYESGQATGCYNRDVRSLDSEFGHHLVDDAIDLSGEAVHGSRLQGLNGVAGDDRSRPQQLHLAQLSAPPTQCFQRDFNSRGYRTSDVLPLSADDIECGGSAEVDHDA